MNNAHGRSASLVAEAVDDRAGDGVDHVDVEEGHLLGVEAARHHANHVRIEVLVEHTAVAEHLAVRVYAIVGQLGANGHHLLVVEVHAPHLVRRPHGFVVVGDVGVGVQFERVADERAQTCAALSTAARLCRVDEHGLGELVLRRRLDLDGAGRHGVQAMLAVEEHERLEVLAVGLLEEEGLLDLVVEDKAVARLLLGGRAADRIEEEDTRL